jgi:hypothetical protein
MMWWLLLFAILCNKILNLFIYRLVDEVLMNYEVRHNSGLGLTTKARACKNVGQEGSPGVTFHVPGNVKECEGMKLHIPKGTPILEVRILTDF